MAWAFRNVRVQPNDLKERAIEQPIDSWLGHGFAKDSDFVGDRQHRCGFGTESLKKRFQGSGIGLGKYLPVVVARDCQDLAGIVFVRTIEFIAVKRFFIVAVDHVAKMKEERG